MAVYTVTLRDVVRQLIADETGGWEDLDSQANWHYAYPGLGLDGTKNKWFAMPPYPIYSEDARAGLNDKIIRAHYMREIGVETVAQFAFRLNQAMHEIMPYYNSLYQLKVLDAAHLIGADYSDLRNVLQNVEGKSESHTEGSTSATNHVDGSTTNTDEVRNLDTPQTRFDAIDDIYLTAATRDKGEGTSETDSTSSGTSESDTNSSDTTDTKRTEELKGMRYDPTQIKNLLEIGRQLLNIDQMVVHDDAIEECFMLIY